jgi:hypothetical protein
MLHSQVSPRRVSPVGVWLVALMAATASAQTINWQSLEIGTLQSTGGFGMTFASLPDGRFVLGQQQKVFVQDAFGAAASTEMAANGVTFDPSFVAVRHGTAALMGQGGSFGAVTSLHPFDPTSPTAGTGGIRPAFPPACRAMPLSTGIPPPPHWKAGSSAGPTAPTAPPRATTSPSSPSTAQSLAP